MNAFAVISVLCIFCAGRVYSMPSLVAQSMSSSSSSSSMSQQSASYASASESSFSSTSSASSSACSPINAALYQEAFGLASINSAEAQLYMNYLNQLSGPQISAFNQLIDIYSLNNYAMADFVDDFVGFQNEMSNIYQLLQAQSLYAANADWATQTSIYQQVQANLATALGYTAPGSCLNTLLTFANTSPTYIPLVAGTCYHLANLQNQYYAASPLSARSIASSTTTSSTSTSSSISTAATTAAAAYDTAAYQNAFTLASINNAETQLYMNYLNQLSGPQISAFNQLIDIYSLNNYAMADYVNDFVGFQNEMSNIYQLLQAQSMYAANADWATQTSIYQQVQANLATALGYTAPGSCLNTLLTFANTSPTYIPLVAGACYHLANLQNQYYAASPLSARSIASSTTTSSTSTLSSTSTVASTAAAAIDTAAYQNAFALASINNAETQLYMNYLNQLSGPQISAFNQLIDIYSLNNYAMADYVNDFAGFQNELSNIYQLLQAQSMYAANADWATQTSIYQQVQANLATALGYTAPGSCLNTLLTYASTNPTYMPLVAGACYHLANLQNQYYAASAASSSSYQAAVSGCSMSQTACSGSTVTVC